MTTNDNIIIMLAGLILGVVLSSADCIGVALAQDPEPEPIKKVCLYSWGYLTIQADKDCPPQPSGELATGQCSPVEGLP